jgi:hypothetical protein
VAVSHGGYHERSRLQHLHTDEDQGPPYTVHVDAWLTRRKRFHMICDRKGGVVFRSRWMGDVLEWLADRGATQYVICGEGRSWSGAVIPLPEKEGN